MINKETYKRFTEKRKGKNVIPLLNSACGVDLPKWMLAEESDIRWYLSGDAVDKLAKLEDKIMDGTLKEFPCKCIEELDVIRKGMIFILYTMCLEQNFGQRFFIKYKSKINEWFKNYLKNKELQEKQECR